MAAWPASHSGALSAAACTLLIFPLWILRCYAPLGPCSLSLANSASCAAHADSASLHNAAVRTFSGQENELSRTRSLTPLHVLAPPIVWGLLGSPTHLQLLAGSSERLLDDLTAPSQAWYHELSARPRPGVARFTQSSVETTP